MPIQKNIEIQQNRLFGVGSIMDLQGKVVFESNNIKGFEELDLSHLKSGTYILNFAINHNMESKKIIKQ